MSDNVRKKVRVEKGESIFFCLEQKIKEITGIQNAKCIKVIFGKYYNKGKKAILWSI